MEASITSASDLSRRSATSLLLPISALSVGTVAYGPWWWTIGLCILFPVILFKAESRLQAFFVALLYHLGASRSLGLAAGSFYGESTFFGLAIWALGNVFNGLIYAGVWHARPNLRIYTILLGLFLTALPPFGVLGWANPLTAAGVLFPGSGLAGFFFIIGLYICIAGEHRSFLKVFIALSLWCLCTAKAPKSDAISGLSTRFHKTDDEGRGDYARQTHLIERVRRSKGKLILLPEGIVTGGWSDAGARLWSEESRPSLIGAELKIERPENVIVNTRSGIVYRQRQPIPLSMWRPFDASSFASHWFEGPMIEVGGKKLAPLICYEGFLVWPIVHSYLVGSEHIIATGNYWWAGGQDIPVIHESIIKSWSRLFSIPYAMAVNQ